MKNTSLIVAAVAYIIVINAILQSKLCLRNRSRKEVKYFVSLLSNFRRRNLTQFKFGVTSLQL